MTSRTDTDTEFKKIQLIELNCPLTRNVCNIRNDRRFYKKKEMKKNHEPPNHRGFNCER